MKITRLAPAKINLTLEIGTKRRDGYHSLRSVMARISLFDKVSVSENDLGVIRFFTDTEGIPTSNLCTRAASAYLEAKGIEHGVDIFLECNIPLASGMGGGSADAAATLEGMEELFGALERQERLSIARSLGADVPFCLEKTPSFCEGIGDECTPIQSNTEGKLWLTLIKKSEKLSTAKVYSDFDSISQHPSVRDHASVIRALATGDIPLLAKSVFNDFEEVVFKSSPELLNWRDFLLEKGALNVVLSGAGPTLVGLFDDKEKALSCGEGVYQIINE